MRYVCRCRCPAQCEVFGYKSRGYRTELMHLKMACYTKSTTCPGIILALRKWVFEVTTAVDVSNGRSVNLIDHFQAPVPGYHYCEK